MKSATPVLIAALALIALSGCGKTAPATALPPIDSVFTRNPTESTRLELGRQQQEREDGDTDTTDTARVGGPSNENKGFRKD